MQERNNDHTTQLLEVESMSFEMPHCELGSLHVRGKMKIMMMVMIILTTIVMMMMELKTTVSNILLHTGNT